MIILRSIFYFTISFVVLSIPIARKPLFFYFHKHLNPYTDQLFDMVEKESRDKIKKGTQMIKNSVSKNDIQDFILKK